MERHKLSALSSQLQLRWLARQELSVLIVLTLILSCTTGQKATYQAPANKIAVVSADTAYTDQIQNPFDDKGVDITLNMSFDEDNNILTLCLKGTRKVFVFRADTYYKKVFRKKFFGKRVLKPENLSYPVLVQPGTSVYLSAAVKSSFVPPKRKHLFNNWLGSISENLTPMTPSIESADPAEVSLINDSIEQRFKVAPTAKEATITLRNLLVVDKYSQGSALKALTAAQKTKKPEKWIIVNDKDLNTTYNIMLKRNPCFGLGELRDSILNCLCDVRDAYHNLLRSCPSGTVESKAALQIFRQHKHYLQAKYQTIIEDSPCPEIHESIEDYNKYVDSIRTAKCVYVQPIDKSIIGGKLLGAGVSAQSLLDAARRIDNSVAQYLMATDATQIHDITTIGQETIRLMNRTIREKGILNDEQRSALLEYRKAEAYFDKIVLKQ